MFDHDPDTRDGPSTSDHADVSAETSGNTPEGRPAATAGTYAGLSDDDLERTLCTHATHIAVAECRFVLMVSEMGRRNAWVVQGARSCAHWLNWRCGISIPTAREQLRVGRALEELPQVRTAFERGELSYSKVRAITRVATPRIERALVEIAGYTTASQLETIVRAYRRVDPSEGAAALARHRTRYLRSYVDGDGMVVINARLSPEDGATVLAAIESARQALRADEEPHTAPSEPPAPRAAPTEVPAELRADDPMGAAAADALLALCEAASADGLPSPSAYGPNASVVVHVDQPVLGDSGAAGCAHLESLGAVSAHTVQRLACDAAVSTLSFRPDGSVVPEGKTRQVPLSLRRAVLTRDGGCRWPGCVRHRYVDIHHVVFVANGGRTRLDNLTTLCRAHHRMVHEGGYRLQLAGSSAVRVFRPDGAEIAVAPALPRPVGPDLAGQHRSEGLAIDDATMLVDGSPFDLSMTIDWLETEAGRHPPGVRRPPEDS